MKQAVPLRELSALDWIAVGLTVLIALILMILPLMVTPAFVAMFADFGGSSLPMCTQVVIRPWYPIIGMLASSAILVLAFLPGQAGLLRRRLMIAVAFLLGCLWIGVYLIGVYTPVFALASAVTQSPGV